MLFRSNLGHALEALQRHDEAVAAFEAAIAVKSTVEAHSALASAYSGLKRFDAAAASYRHALELAPDDANALGGLAHALQRICDWRERDQVLARILAQLRTSAAAIPPFNFLALVDDPQEQLECARRAWSGPSVRRSFPKRAAAGRRLRIGYLSADFHAHATAYLMAGLFEGHDRSRFELVALSHGPDDRSPLRRRLERSFDAFVDLRGAVDDDAERRILEREIDILVDLKGHTGNNRLRWLSRRLAPVQAHYLGYPGTLGADFVDYFMADRFTVPPGAERDFIESIVYLPGCYQVNDRNRGDDQRTPTRAECGLPEGGFVFCCFNNNYKIVPEVFAVWMRLLRALPDSALWLLADNQWAEANLRREAQAAGVDPARVVFAPRTAPGAHLARQRVEPLDRDLNAYRDEWFDNIEVFL